MVVVTSPVHGWMVRMVEIDEALRKLFQNSELKLTRLLCGKSKSNHYDTHSIKLLTKNTPDPLHPNSS